MPLDRRYLAAIRLERDDIPDRSKYPFNIPGIKNLRRLEFHPNVTFLIGENGVGKSTIIEAIAVKMRFNAEGGSRNFSFETRATHSELHRHLTIERGTRYPKDGYYLRAESYYNLATAIEHLDDDPELIGVNAPPVKRSYGGRSLHNQSHGESFISLLRHRLGGNGLYIFDEPEAALSPTRQMGVLNLIENLVNLKSQFIIATHSPILMAYPRALIYEVGAKGIKKVSYVDTEHYKVTRDFLNRYEKMLEILLKNDGEEPLI